MFEREHNFCAFITVSYMFRYIITICAHKTSMHCTQYSTIYKTYTVGHMYLERASVSQRKQSNSINIVNNNNKNRIYISAVQKSQSSAKHSMSVNYCSENYSGANCSYIFNFFFIDCAVCGLLCMSSFQCFFSTFPILFAAQFLNFIFCFVSAAPPITVTHIGIHFVHAVFSRLFFVFTQLKNFL